jgi:hypothetical protein
VLVDVAKDRASPVLPFTRAVFVVGVSLTACTGIGLFAVPDRTADYWAWTIKAPLSAAFFGAGYVGAATSFALAVRTREWKRTRAVLLAALTLTSLALLTTLRHLGTFAFGSGGLPEAVAWIWLAVYVALPPLLIAAFVLQERAGGSREYGGGLPALAATRLALGGAGIGLGVLGIGLLVEWAALIERWPWPLPPLPASVLGGWLCTYAAAFLWFAVREREWSRVRIGVAPAMISFALDLIAAERFRNDFRSGAETAAYVACLAALLAVLSVAAYAEERRLRIATADVSSLPGLGPNQQASG